MSNEQFPVARFRITDGIEDLLVPEFVPRSLLQPFEDNGTIQRLHSGQTLNQLAARGGLGVLEICQIIKEREIPVNPDAKIKREAIIWLNEELKSMLTEENHEVDLTIISRK